MEFFTPTGELTIMGSNHVYPEHIRRCEYEQGEGKTVTIVSGDSRPEVSYEKVGNNLVIKADGQECALSPATVVITDQEQLDFRGTISTP